MSNDNHEWIPTPTEHPVCAVCDGDRSVEVSAVGRNGVSVRNVTCVECGLVFVSPRPSPAAMADFYRSQYRAQHVLPMKTRDGRVAHPGTAEYEDAQLYRAEVLAFNAMAGGMVKAGERVLDVGCRRGDVLTAMNKTVPIEMHGIEPDVKSCVEGERRGIVMHNGVMETYDPGELRFDQIQLFHVLEHIHDPLAALVRLRGWLKPRGRLVIEVPDVEQPYGGLSFFFQYPHLYSFSAQTLGALLRRAGFRVLVVGPGTTLYIVSTPDPLASAVPIAYAKHHLGDNPIDGEQMASRLQLYDALETAKRLVAKGANVPVDVVCRIVSLPALRPTVEHEKTHLFLATLSIADVWLRAGRHEDAVRLLRAGRDGPRCDAVARGFDRVLRAVMAEIASASPSA